MDDEPTSNGGGDEPEKPRDSLVPAGLPSRSAYVLAFLSVVLAGAFGGIIGYGLVDLREWQVAGALVESDGRLLFVRNQRRGGKRAR